MQLHDHECHVERAKELFDDVTIVGLADDYRFVGPVDAAMDAAAMYKTQVEAAGHVFQANKSWLFSRSTRTLPDDERPVAGQHLLPTPRAAIFLGCGPVALRLPRRF